MTLSRARRRERSILQRTSEGEMPRPRYGWHTHGDVLAELRELPTDQGAVDEFVAEVLNGTALIATISMNGDPVDVWICDDSHYTRKYFGPGESISFRRWNGVTVDGIADAT
jgi:hypothetical protein